MAPTCRSRADATTTLQRLIDSNLEDYLPKFESVSEAASKEHVFERNLEKMKVSHFSYFTGLFSFCCTCGQDIGVTNKDFIYYM